MTYLLDYDRQTGDILGFYLEDVAHPDGCALLTEEVWSQLLKGYTRFRLKLPAPDDAIKTMDSFEPYDPPPVDPRSEREKILDELASLDPVLPRCVEDMLAVAGVPIETLPQIMQERLARKIALREQLNTL